MIEKRKFLSAVQAADFAVTETRLYLDTHPCDEAAANALRVYSKKAAQAREEYEKRYGSLTGGSDSCAGERWTDDPWPWNYAAN